MTERLYYSDPHLIEFDGVVTAIEAHGERASVYLDRTAFYPTSGGQPHDLGTLGGLRVVDVVDEDDGRIAHVVESGEAPLSVGAAVHGSIEWRRRFDHMQQHTGQHILSAAFDHLFGARTVSFHLGSDTSTIDIAAELSPRDLARGEDEANRVVWADGPVTVTFVTSEEAAKLPLRKEPAREGLLRLVDVEGMDLSACGGTHVRRTGAVGLVAIRSWERFKGGQRIEFACGGRALAQFRRLRDTADGASRLLSIGPDELGSSIERLMADAKEQKRAMTGLQTELAGYKGAELAATAEATACGPCVFRAVDADAVGLKALASAVVATPGHAAVLVSTSTPSLVVVARAADSTVAANNVLAALIAAFGGRGGGKPDMAHGGGLTASADAILDAARAAING